MTRALGRHDDDAGLTLSVSLGEGMEGVAWQMNAEEGCFFLVLQLVFTIEIRSNNGVQCSTEEKSRKPQFVIIE